MSIVRCRNHGKRRIRVCQSGEVKMEMLLGGALAIIIIGSLALMIVPLFRGPPRGAISDEKWHYQCQECKGEWEVDAKEIVEGIDALAGEDARLGGGDEPQFYYPDCPLCGAKGSSIKMIQCLNEECAKYFVTDDMKSFPPLSDRFMRGEIAPQVCPYCGTDRMEVTRERAIKARKSRGG